MIPSFLLRFLSPGSIAMSATVALGLVLSAAVAMMRHDVRVEAIHKCESDLRAKELAAALGAALQDNQTMAETIQRRDLAAAEADRRVKDLVETADALREQINKADPKSGEVVFEAGDEWLTKRAKKK